MQPCPFCGSTHLKEEYGRLITGIDGLDRQEGWVECLTCQAAGPMVMATGEETDRIREMVGDAWDGRATMAGQAERSFPFVIEAKSIAGGTVKDACHAAVELSRHIRCMVETEINDIKITVSGAVMTGEDAYEQWKHYSANACLSHGDDSATPTAQ